MSSMKDLLNCDLEELDRTLRYGADEYDLNRAIRNLIRRIRSMECPNGQPLPNDEPFASAIAKAEGQ